MVNPGSFSGSRKEFLIAEKAAYRAAVLGGYAADELAGIQRRYFKRFPVDLADDEEPSVEQLANVDDDAPDDEYPEPDQETMSVEDYEDALKALAARRKLVTFRKAQIKRWHAYQFMKDSDMDPKEPGALNPHRVLLHKLTNVGLTRPRLMNTANLWRKSHRAEVEAETERRIAAAGTAAPKRNQLVTFRDKVARDLFGSLSKEDKDEWAQRAKDEHASALVQWKKEIDSPPSQEPADRQRCIQSLVKFTQPILDLICEATGWTATLIAGGPEPAAGGRVHSGATPGDIKMNFGRAERQRYKTHIVPVYSTFLRKCFSVEECRTRALLVEDEIGGLANVNFDVDGANFDSASMSDSSTATAYPDDSAVTSSTVVASDDTLSTMVEPLEFDGAQTLNNAAITSPAPPHLSATVSSAVLPSTTPGPSNNVASPVSPSRPTRQPPASPASVHSNHQSLPLSPMQSRRSSPLRLPADSNRRLSLQRAEKRTPSREDESASSTESVERETLPPPEPSSENPSEPDEADNTPPTESPAQKSSRITRLQAASQSRKRPASQEHDLEQEQPQSKRLRLSAPTPANLRANSSRKSLVKSLAKAAPKISNSRARAAPASPAKRPSALSRRRKSATTSLPPPVIPPSPVDEHAAEWFKPILGMFRSEDLGLQWSSLVTRWSMFEQREKYDCPSRLSAKHRPSMVGDWIRRARLVSWRPAIKDIGAYEEGCRVWWTALQPAWRVSDGLLKLDIHDGDWEILRRAGTNGIVSFLWALFRWGLHIRDEGDGDDDMWNVIIIDCNRALIHLLA